MSVDEGGGLDATLRRLEALRYSSLMEARGRSTERCCVWIRRRMRKLCVIEGDQLGNTLVTQIAEH